MFIIIIVFDHIFIYIMRQNHYVMHFVARALEQQRADADPRTPHMRFRRAEVPRASLTAYEEEENSDEDEDVSMHGASSASKARDARLTSSSTQQDARTSTPITKYTHARKLRPSLKQEERDEETQALNRRIRIAI
jgi:hypothetical protein